MTVRERAEQVYNLDLQEVATSVRKVLEKHSIYKRASERPGASADGLIFYTYVQPDIPLVLGTKMYISLEPRGEQTVVDVTVESQPWILGDAFGMYDRYMHTFFERLKEAATRVPDGQSAQVTSGGLVYQKANGLSWTIVAGGLLLLYVVMSGSIFSSEFFSFSSVFSWIILAFFLVVLAAFIRALISLWRSR